VKGAGLPRIRLHDLRHTHATLALEAGIHPQVISERLGHSTVSITLDIYSHAIPALQETAAELVAALVLGAEADRGWPQRHPSRRRPDARGLHAASTCRWRPASVSSAFRCVSEVLACIAASLSLVHRAVEFVLAAVFAPLTPCAT
jgi:hypothetical protein